MTRTALPPQPQGDPSRLKASSRHLREIVAGMSDGVILIDTHRHIVWANPYALQMHGVETVEGLGADVDDYARRFDVRFREGAPGARDGRPPMERLVSGDPLDETLIDVNPHGSNKRHWTYRIRSLVMRDDDSRAEGFVLILDDETERYDAEARFEQYFRANPAPAAILRLDDLRFLRAKLGLLRDDGLQRGRGRRALDLRGRRAGGARRAASWRSSD